MAVRGKKLNVKDLRVGMYVSDLDRPWCQTPFPIQGFFVEQEDDIKKVSAFCKTVIVDETLNRSGQRNSGHRFDETGTKTQRGNDSVSKRSEGLKLPPIRIKNPMRYDVVTSLKKEVEVAKHLHHKVEGALGRVLEQVQNGVHVSIHETESAAEQMVDSVIRNPDAMVWLGRFRSKDEHGFAHSVNASVWGLVFGRQLGLSKELLRHLATGILLSHIGKLRLPASLLDQRNSLDEEGFHAYQKYVEYGVDMLESSGNVSRQVISIVRHHKERHNGTGYPQGITGDRIPLLAKIAGLVDTYQEMISPWKGINPLTPAQAISRLYELRNIEYQEDLVEQFIMAVGVYPTGSVVELSNREVGIVVTNNTTRRLEPKVMIVMDGAHQEMKNGKVVDLFEFNEKRSTPVKISNSLPYDSLDIDVSKYQVTGATRRWSMRHLMG